jgi:hypothetical protein
LPFGPPESALSVERIVRLAPPTTPIDLAIDTSDLATTISLQPTSERETTASVAPAAMPTDSPPSSENTESVSVPVQLSAWGTTGPAPRPRPVARIAVVAAVAVAIAGAAVTGMLWWRAGGAVSVGDASLDPSTKVDAAGTVSPAASTALDVAAPTASHDPAPIAAPTASTKVPVAPTAAPARSGKPAPKPLHKPAPSVAATTPTARPALVGLDNPN